MVRAFNTFDALVPKVSSAYQHNRWEIYSNDKKKINGKKNNDEDSELIAPAYFPPPLPKERIKMLMLQTAFRIGNKRRKEKTLLKLLTHLRRNKITRTLLDSNLTRKRMWHFLSIPFQSFQIVFISIEKMNLASRLLDARMQIEHF